MYGSEDPFLSRSAKVARRGKLITSGQFHKSFADGAKKCFADVKGSWVFQHTRVKRKGMESGSEKLTL